ncbi:hypothetical protein KEM54_006574 [Ascosphaera aggregata]|nr:hypothetical protein KEM54_006574 [Ascosphaera aggregata]
MSSSIEAIYIYDELKPPAPKVLISHYNSHPAPRPSLLYVPDACPPITIFSVTHSHLLFLVPSTTDVDPLLVLEFLHRVIDVLEEFVCNGGPLISTKIQAQYEVVAQLLNEMCDGGIVCDTEPNSLRELVEVPGWLDKLLGNVGLPSAPGLSQATHPKAGPSKKSPFTSNIGTLQPIANPAIPWRRSGVRHTSNELYVDIIESLNVTMAPSGRILSAISSGSILFTAKISGVPDLTLSLTAPGGAAAMRDRLQLPVFHPCVRLNRWRDKPGELSFIPPDGRFVLAGYEVNLSPVDPEADDSAAVTMLRMEKPFIPATAELKQGLGANGLDFEVTLRVDANFPGHGFVSSSSAFSSRHPSSRGFGSSGFGSGGGTTSPNGPSFSDDIVVGVPIPSGVRNVTDLRASRGEATFSPGDKEVIWSIPTRKDVGSVVGIATLRGTIVKPMEEEPIQVFDEEVERDEGSTDSGSNVQRGNQTVNALMGYYDDAQQTQASQNAGAATATSARATRASTKNPQKTASLMPNSVSVSFTVRGWVPSGIKVDALNLDPRRSRGVPDTIKPYKGVKYICVSRRGVERRASYSSECALEDE